MYNVINLSTMIVRSLLEMDSLAAVQWLEANNFLQFENLTIGIWSVYKTFDTFCLIKY